MKKFIMTMGCLVALIALAAKPATATLLTNPGFETGTLAGWSTAGDGWDPAPSSFVLNVHSGSYGEVDVVDIGQSTGYRVLSQNVAANPGEAYTGGVWLHTASLESNSESWFELQFLDSGNGVLAQYQSAHVTADQPFTYMGIGWVNAPVGTVAASVRSVVFAGSLGGSADFHVFDDFEFVGVPEPSVAGLLAIGGLLAAARRRKA